MAFGEQVRASVVQLRSCSELHASALGRGHALERKQLATGEWTAASRTLRRTSGRELRSERWLA